MASTAFNAHSHYLFAGEMLGDLPLPIWSVDAWLQFVADGPKGDPAVW